MNVDLIDAYLHAFKLVMNMIQRQLGLVPSIVRKEDKGEYIQSLVDSRENENSTIAQDVMLCHHIANLNLRTLKYPENDTVNLQPETICDTGNDTVNSQNDTVSELKEGLKRIYIATQKKIQKLPIHNLWTSSTSPNQPPSE